MYLKCIYLFIINYKKTQIFNQKITNNNSNLEKLYFFSKFSYCSHRPIHNLNFKLQIYVLIINL